MDTTKAGTLKVEAGPTKDVTPAMGDLLRRRRQAGQSRLFGGIHIQADDFTGRKLGAECGKEAWARAQTYYSGAASQ